MVNTSESRMASLSLVPMFADLDRPQLELLAQHAEEINVDAGSVLVREGDVGDRFILLLGGSARVERNGQVLAHLSTDQFVGEMSLLDGKPRAATVIMETPGPILVINRDTFRSLLDTVPEFRETLLTVLCDRLRDLQAPLSLDGHRPAPQPIELDHLYAFGEVYDTLDVCDQVMQALSRLKRHGLLSVDDLNTSRQYIDAVRDRLEQRLNAPSTTGTR
jgi:CRP/FNR family transcriptional regulator, cyclic AMP receptor protein